jgi:hypothetical protein
MSSSLMQIVEEVGPRCTCFTCPRSVVSTEGGAVVIVLTKQVLMTATTRTSVYSGASEICAYIRQIEEVRERAYHGSVNGI